MVIIKKKVYIYIYCDYFCHFRFELYIYLFLLLYVFIQVNITLQRIVLFQPFKSFQHFWNWDIWLSILRKIVCEKGNYLLLVYVVLKKTSISKEWEKSRKICSACWARFGVEVRLLFEGAWSWSSEYIINLKRAWYKRIMLFLHDRTRLLESFKK